MYKIKKTYLGYAYNFIGFYGFMQINRKLIQRKAISHHKIAKNILPAHY
jgi:hypothetical protein